LTRSVENANESHMHLRPPLPSAGSRSSSQPFDQAAAAVSKTLPRRANSRDLLGEGKLLVIDHDGAEYLLRVTANGRLLLTK
jgi:hemin uptake protein HemP